MHRVDRESESLSAAAGQVQVYLTTTEHLSVPTTSSIEDVTGTQKSSFRRIGLTYPLHNKHAVCEQTKQSTFWNGIFFFSFPAGCREDPDCRAICKIVA